LGESIGTEGRPVRDAVRNCLSPRLRPVQRMLRSNAATLEGAHFPSFVVPTGHTAVLGGAVVWKRRRSG
jgi:hypothetical protein